MKFKENIDHMRIAIDEARKNMDAMHGGPFGACVVKDDKVIAVAHNTVLKHRDPTCHAEVNAIRKASAELGTHDLSGCVIYSTTEPCPMCFSAIHWARIHVVVYGASLEDAKQAGFNELDLSAEHVKTHGKSEVVLVRSALAEECRDMMTRWCELPHKRTY